MRIIKVILFLLVAGFVAIQFVRPAKNDAEPDGRDLFALYDAPAEVKTLVQTTCYDCHSNRTRYPWYAQVQPVRWWLDSHVADGKKDLNFSEFGDYSQRQRARKLLSVADEVLGKTMPLESYTWAHREAKLSDVQIALLSGWAEELSEEIEEN